MFSVFWSLVAFREPSMLFSAIDVKQCGISAALSLFILRWFYSQAPPPKKPADRYLWVSFRV